MRPAKRQGATEDIAARVRTIRPTTALRMGAIHDPSSSRKRWIYSATALRVDAIAGSSSIAAMPYGGADTIIADTRLAIALPGPTAKGDAMPSGGERKEASKMIRRPVTSCARRCRARAMYVVLYTRAQRQSSHRVGRFVRPGNLRSHAPWDARWGRGSAHPFKRDDADPCDLGEGASG